MDIDKQALETALGVLHQQFGNQLAGAIGHTQVQMRRALEQQMGIDEVAADRLVKQLTHVGRLVYHGSGADDGYAVETAVLAPLPGALARPDGTAYGVPLPELTGAEESKSAGPPPDAALTPVAAASAGPGTATTGIGLPGAIPVVAGLTRPEASAGSPGEAARAAAENREGVTAGGQLADTNVVAPSSPSEQVLATGIDDAEGYWQIA